MFIYSLSLSRQFSQSANKKVTLLTGRNENEGMLKVGDRYKVIDLIGSGWDLVRVTGIGPEYLRIINSEMQKYVRVLK